MDFGKVRVAFSFICFILIILSILYNLEREGYLDIDLPIVDQPIEDAPPEILKTGLYYEDVDDIDSGGPSYIYYEYQNVCHSNQLNMKHSLAYFDTYSGVCYANISLHFQLQPCGELSQWDIDRTITESWCTNGKCTSKVPRYVSDLYPSGYHNVVIRITDLITNEETKETLHFQIH